MKDFNETHAYAYALGYYEGRSYGEQCSAWKTEEEALAYKWGYEVGVKDYCEIDTYTEGGSNEY
jgi:hypothetical protein